MWLRTTTMTTNRDARCHGYNIHIKRCAADIQSQRFKQQHVGQLTPTPFTSTSFVDLC